MKTIAELRDSRAKLWSAMESFLDTHANDKGVLSAEDDATYNKMEKDLEDLTTEIKRRERKEAIEAELNKPVAAPLTGKPMTASAEEDEKKGRASKGYKKNFWNAMRSKMPSADVLNALSEGTDADGGFLVPDTFERTLVDGLNDTLIIRKLAHVFETASGAHKIPVVSAHGAASWTDEGAQIPETTHKFSEKSIGAHKLTALIKVSEELLYDSAFDLESYFSQEFARQISNAEEDAFVSGTGTDRPFGIFDEKEGGEVGVTTAGATITADELIDLYHSLRAPYRKKAVWLLNDTTIQAVRKLKDENKQYIWQPSLQVGLPDTLLGRPVYTTNSIPGVAAGAKVIAFGDLSYYWIGDRTGITFKRLNELYADRGQIGFLATKRVDARLVLPEAVKILQIKAGS